MEYVFTAELWVWDSRRSDTWTFVTLPPEDSDDLRERVGARGGFGSIPVLVRIGSTEWRTSVFPDKESGCFVLPVKAAVRNSEGLAPGDTARVALRPI
jgi:hypothetical protein